LFLSQEIDDTKKQQHHLANANYKVCSYRNKQEKKNILFGAKTYVLRKSKLLIVNDVTENFQTK